MLPILSLYAAVGFTSLPPATPLLASTLDAVGVTTTQLAEMAVYAYNASAARGLDDWQAVTVGAGTGVVGAVFEKNGKRILSFRGAELELASLAYTCVIAEYLHKGTSIEEEATRQCDLVRDAVPQRSIEEFAADAQRLVLDNQPIDLLTGHSVGCDLAKTEGRRLTVPAVCFAAIDSFSPTWYEAYPGLKDASPDVWSPAAPIFVLQAYTDLYSNCAYPTAAPRERLFAAATCAFAAQPPGCDGVTVEVDYTFGSECQLIAHNVPQTRFVPLTFDDDACTTQGQAKVQQCAIEIPP